MSEAFSLTRFLAIFIKEFIQMRRDRITFAMMLGVPMMQLVLFGFAINSDPKHLPAALLDLAHDRYSRAVSQAFEHSGYYRFEHLPASVAEAEALLAKGAVSFIVTIPGDFGTRAARGDSPKVLVEADASDPAAASNAVGVLGTIAGRALTRELGQEQAEKEESRRRVEIVTHRRHNPEGISQYNTVPGLLGVILQMTMVMMTAMALVRETERGTMENLLAMPAAPAEIMLGKITPYLGVGMVQVIVVLIAAKKMFAVPFVGDLSLLLFSIFIFVISLVLLGYAISTFARAQMQAMQLSVFVFLPSLLLSGFMFPFAGMPGWAQVLGEAFPLTHFLRVVRAVMLKGADFSAVAGEMAVLLLFVGLYAALALARFRRTLD